MAASVAFALAAGAVTPQEVSWAAFMRRIREPAPRLRIHRGDREFEVGLRREKLPAAGSGVRVALSAFAPVLHLAVGRFTAATADAVRAALSRSNDAAVVVDLRNDPGGDLAAALEVAGALVGERDSARMDQAAGEKVLRGRGAAEGRHRLAVVVNEGTASAAELLAVALVAQAHALVAGMPTMRKCLVHSLLSLDAGDAVLFTKARLRALDGTSICAAGARIGAQVPWAASVRVPLPVPATEADPQFAAAARSLADER